MNQYCKVWPEIFKKTKNAEPSLSLALQKTILLFTATIWITV